MSAFDRSLRLFPVSAVLVSGMFASLVGSDGESVSAQESPVTGSSFSSATSVHDDKHVRNAVLQHSVSESRPLGEIQRGWTAAHGKAPARSKSKEVVSLQSADTRPHASLVRTRKPNAAAPSSPRAVFMVSAGRPAIPPVPEPVRENTPPEDLEAVELAPVEPAPASDKSVAEPSIPDFPPLEPSASDVIAPQQSSVVTPPSREKVPAASSVNTEQKVLSASQLLKLALEEERRNALAEQAASNEETPELPSLNEGSIDLDPVEDLADDMSAGQSPSQSDPQLSAEAVLDESENSLLDERARRFVRLKQQLMQLKSQLQQPDTVDESEQQPVMADNEQADPEQNHSAQDHDAVQDQHSEELLPPVEGHEDHDSKHPAKANHASEDSGVSLSPDPSAQSHSSDVVTEHSETPHGHEAVEHEPSVDTHAAEPNHGDDNNHTDGSHGDVATGEHSAASGAAHAASEHAVVHGTIDRLGLANNLYAVGEYELALDMYEKIDMTELTAQQQIWTDYQMANCLRRMGRNGDASNRYRRIAEQPEAGWLSEQSRWWVEVLEQIRQLQNSLEENDVDSEKNLQSPFQGAPRESRSSESREAGSTKTGSMKSGITGHTSGTNAKFEHNSSSSSGRSSSRVTKPSKERITHFAPVEKEPKHGEH